MLHNRDSLPQLNQISVQGILALAKGDKTRTSSNHHCFTDQGLLFWSNIAGGQKPYKEMKSTPDGHVFEYDSDADGYEINNGGIERPVIRDLGTRKIIRFFKSTITVEEAIVGNW